jgi:hypothetical protein
VALFNFKARVAIQAARAAKGASKKPVITPEQQLALDTARDARAGEFVATIMQVAATNAAAQRSERIKALAGIVFDVPLTPNDGELAHIAAQSRGANGAAFVPYMYQGSGKFANIAARAIDMINAMAASAGVEPLTWRDTRGSGNAASGAADVQYGSLAWSKAGITPAVLTMPDGSRVPTSAVLNARLSANGNAKLTMLAARDAGWSALVKALLAADKANADQDALIDAIQSALDNANAIVTKAREQAAEKAAAK